MKTDIKQAPAVFSIKKLEQSGAFEGYASTFGGEPDAYGDVIAVGAFSESLSEYAAKGAMPKMFWQHDASQPIGRWVSMSEDEIGLKVEGQLNMDVQRGREAHSLLKNKDIDGLSIGYQIKEYSVDKETGIWTLENLDLKEVSVVSIGANSDALVSGVKAAKAHHLRMDELMAKVAAGDRLTLREFEDLAKGTWQLSNSQAERAARIHLNGLGEPADADEGLQFLQALAG